MAPMATLLPLPLLLLLALLALPALSSPVCLAHRGSSFRFPENTLLSFEKAKEEGADAIELDINLSRDGVIIVMHDETLDRTTNCTGRVDELDYYGYIEYCLIPVEGGEGGYERVPLLQEVIDFAGENNLDVLLDLKVSDPEVVIPLCKILQDAQWDALDRVLLGAWTSEMLQEIINGCPNAKRSLISETIPEDPATWNVHNFNLMFTALQEREDFVEKARSNGQTVYGWTLNTEELMQAAIDMDIDGVVTDYPQEYLALVKENKRFGPLAIALLVVLCVVALLAAGAIIGYVFVMKRVTPSADDAPQQSAQSEREPLNKELRQNYAAEEEV